MAVSFFAPPRPGGGQRAGSLQRAASADDAVAAAHTVRIDAIVVDARGAAVPTLAPREFDLREDGKPVVVDDAQFQNKSPRLVGIYLDEYHITPGADADRAREALLQFVDRE